jgi:hypothetical protein
MSEDKQDAPEPKKSVSLDLSGLGSLSLGPSWGAGDAPEPKLPKERDDRRGGDRGDRRPGGGGSRRERRPPRDREGSRSDRREGEGGRPDRRETSRSDRRGGGYTQEVFQPILTVDFYPEDTPFKVLIQAIKQSHRTFELFEIARLILEKPERFVCVAKHPLQREGEPARLWASVPDGLPFATETEAVNHVMKHHLGSFFEVEEREVDPPAGNFQMIHRCGYTNELLAPPNYHRFQAICQEHHASRLAHISFERFQKRIESVREPEAIAEWLEKMKRRLHYRLKMDSGAPQPAPLEGGEEEPAAPEETSPKADGKEFDSLEAARFYLLTHCKEKLVRPAYSARFSGKDVLLLPDTDPVRRSIEVLHEQQMKFPLETANHLRGRLRRLNFAVYKKGSKGVSFVCAVKRRFRQADEKFADNLSELIEFIEAHPNIQAKLLPREFLGVEMREDADLQSLSEADQAKVAELRKDLKYLVASGYVIEYSDGRLFLPPPRSEGAGDEDGESKDASGRTPEKAEKPANQAATHARREEPPPPVAEAAQATTLDQPSATEPPPVAQETKPDADADSESEPKAVVEEPEPELEPEAKSEPAADAVNPPIAPHVDSGEPEAAPAEVPKKGDS